MCDCITKVDEQLKERGVRLERIFSLGGKDIKEYLPIYTTRIDTGKRGKKPTLIPAYCPFCGEKALPKSEYMATTAEAT